MKNQLKRNFLRAEIAIVIVLFSSGAMAQGLRFQIWSDFNGRFELNNKLQVNIEPGYRIEPESGIQTAYLRPTLRYSPNRLFSFDAGFANFNVWGADIFNSIELRTFQFAFLNWPEILDFNFKLRLGLEQRWFRFPELEANEFVMRARLRVGLTSPYFGFWQGRSRLFITTNYELLRDAKDEAIDILINENRFMIGLGFLDNKNFRGELHYQIHGLRDRSIKTLIGDKNLIRIRAFYYFRKNES